MLAPKTLFIAAVALFAGAPGAVSGQTHPERVAAVGVHPDAAPAARHAWRALPLGDAALLAPLEPAWTRGPARWTRREGGRFAVSRDLDLARVPLAHRARLGATVTLWTAAGARCEARVEALAAESHFVDHGSVWDVLDPDVAPPARADQRPDDAWDDGLQVLVAHLAPRGAACPGTPVLVTDARGPQPAFFTPRAVSDALARRALAAFRALPEHAALQRDYDAALADEGAWRVRAPATWDRHDGAVPRVTGYQRGERHVVAVHVDTLSTCGDPGGALLGVFEVAAGGALRPLGAAAYVEPLDGVLDLDGDGDLEAIVVDPTDAGGAVRVLRLDALDSDPILETVVPDHTDEGCPC